jgi:glycosyltransferase involved in cell wall biosynthesis
MNLINEIQKLGYNVIVLSPKDEYVVKLIENGIQHQHINMSQYGMNPLSELKTMYEVYKNFKKYNPEYSLHYTIKPNIFASIAAKISGTKVINNVAGAGKAFSKDGLFQKFIQMLYKISLSKSKRVFFQNYDDMNLFLDNAIVKKEIAYRIPGSGVDLMKYKFSPLNKEKIKFLFIGRLLKEKGIEYYLEAAKMVLLTNDNVEFYIIGEHEEHKDYIDIEKLNTYLKDNHIIYLGTVSPDLMPKVIGDTSCVILPSYYREGVPRSLLESASMGKPIITTENVGCKEVVDEGKNGYKCEVKNLECLVNKITQFIELSFEEKVKMSQYSRMKMEKEFSEKIVLDAYINIIKNEN